MKRRFFLYILPCTVLFSGIYCAGIHSAYADGVIVKNTDIGVSYQRAKELVKRGEDSGTPDPLYESVTILQKILEEGEIHKENPAKVYFLLGQAIFQLGELERKKDHYDNALAVYKKALAMPHEQVRNMAQALQFGLVQALWGLSLHTTDQDIIGETIGRGREAVDSCARNNDSALCFGVQWYLASALTISDGGKKDRQEAVRLFRGLLTPQLREEFPEDWAKVQCTLGDTLIDLRYRDLFKREKYYGEAAVAYRAALDVLTWESAQEVWASAREGLGQALVNTGEPEEGERLFRETLAVIPPDQFPYERALLQLGIAEAIREIAVKEDRLSVERFKEAEAALNAARNILQDDIRAVIRIKGADVYLNIALRLGNMEP